MSRFVDHPLPPNGFHPQQPFSHHAGQKRHADEEFESQSNISNKFKKLRLSQLPHRPVTHHFPARAVLESDHVPPAREQGPVDSVQSPPPVPPSTPQTQLPPPELPSADFMPVDENPHLIVIHDLDAELREIEEAEAANSTQSPFSSSTNNNKAPLFPADIDKHVSGLPGYLLRGGNSNSRPDHSNPNPNTQLILYREPTSISVPEAEDAVRKAIIAARKRVREKQVEDKAKEEEEEIQRKGGGVSINNHIDHSSHASINALESIPDHSNPWVNGFYPPSYAESSQFQRHSGLRSPSSPSSSLPQQSVPAPSTAAMLEDVALDHAPNHYCMEDDDDDNDPDAMDIS